MSDSGRQIGDSDCHYSGNQSAAWWKRIRATKDDNLYALACQLQDLEVIVLRRLEAAEKRR